MSTFIDVITVRKSGSVVGAFNVYLERGPSRVALATHLTENQAIALSRAKAWLLKIDVKLYTLHDTLETVVINNTL